MGLCLESPPPTQPFPLATLAPATAGAGGRVAGSRGRGRRLAVAGLREKSVKAAFSRSRTVESAIDNAVRQRLLESLYASIGDLRVVFEPQP